MLEAADELTNSGRGCNGIIRKFFPIQYLMHGKLRFFISFFILKNIMALSLFLEC